jgi:hypothetical protein
MDRLEGGLGASRRHHLCHFYRDTQTCVRCRLNFRMNSTQLRGGRHAQSQVESHLLLPQKSYAEKVIVQPMTCAF